MKLSLIVNTHVLLSACAFLFFLGTGFLGMIHLVHENRLRRKTWDGRSLRLPSLVQNEKQAARWIRIGLLFLTAALVTGFYIYWEKGERSFFGFFHILLALGAWGFYLLNLNKSWVGRHGRQLLLFSFLGFLSLLGAFLWS